jgi:ADP-ribosylglycohydrolase
MPEPSNYAEKVYAGVLGKVIGVYIGQPFEGWTNERIEKELGEVNWYVNEKFNLCAGMTTVAGRWPPRNAAGI